MRLFPTIRDLIDQTGMIGLDEIISRLNTPKISLFEQQLNLPRYASSSTKLYDDTHDSRSWALKIFSAAVMILSPTHEGWHLIIRDS